jgi:hypothetical protein
MELLGVLGVEGECQKARSPVVPQTLSSSHLPLDPNMPAPCSEDQLRSFRAELQTGPGFWPVPGLAAPPRRASAFLVPRVAGGW